MIQLVKDKANEINLKLRHILFYCMDKFLPSWSVYRVYSTEPSSKLDRRIADRVSQTWQSYIASCVYEYDLCDGIITF